MSVVKNPADVFTQEYFVGSTISSYSDYSNTAGVLRTYADILLGLFKPRKVFDAGCAYGHAVSRLIEQGVYSRGCDASEWASAQNEYVYQSSITCIPEEEASYDLVTCTEVMEHIPEEAVVASLKELVRISSKYVVLLISMFPEGTLSDPGDKTHITLHPREWWLHQCGELGVRRDLEKEEALNSHPYSISMKWNGRFIVLEKLEKEDSK